MVNGSKEWCDTVFDQVYFHIYDPSCKDVTEREVRGITELLALSPGCSLLDMACGYGRHCKVFGDSGFSVTGVDLSGPMIEIARSKYSRTGVKYVVGDMRNVDLNRQFDAALNLYISFGFFKDQKDNLEVLRNIARHLVPHGKFLLELVNPFNAVSDERKSGSRDEDTGEYLARIRKTIDPKTMWETYNLRVFDKATAQEIKNVDAGYYLYTIPQIADMAEEAGLELSEFYGCDYHVFEKKPYGFDATRIILIFEKRE